MNSLLYTMLPHKHTLFNCLQSMKLHKCAHAVR